MDIKQLKFTRTITIFLAILTIIVLNLNYKEIHNEVETTASTNIESITTTTITTEIKTTTTTTKPTTTTTTTTKPTTTTTKPATTTTTTTTSKPVAQLTLYSTSVKTTTYETSKNLGTFYLTVYTPYSDGGQWGYQTSTGVRSTHLKTCAVDPKVIPLGSTIEVNGLVLKAVDVGGAVKGNHIDIFFDGTDSEAIAWLSSFGEYHTVTIL